MTNAKDIMGKHMKIAMGHHRCSQCKYKYTDDNILKTHEERAHNKRVSDTMHQCYFKAVNYSHIQRHVKAEQGLYRITEHK